MIRGGLGQNRASAPSVCLLCRHRWQQSQQLRRPAFRSYANWGGGLGGRGGGWGKPPMANKDNQSSTSTSETPSSAPDPFAGLLPHERILKEAMLKKRAEAEERAKAQEVLAQAEAAKVQARTHAFGRAFSGMEPPAGSPRASTTGLPPRPPVRKIARGNTLRGSPARDATGDRSADNNLSRPIGMSFNNLSQSNGFGYKGLGSTMRQVAPSAPPASPAPTPPSAPAPKPPQPASRSLKGDWGASTKAQTNQTSNATASSSADSDLPDPFAGLLPHERLLREQMLIRKSQSSPPAATSREEQPLVRRVGADRREGASPWPQPSLNDSARGLGGSSWADLTPPPKRTQPSPDFLAQAQQRLSVSQDKPRVEENQSLDDGSSWDAFESAFGGPGDVKKKRKPKAQFREDNADTDVWAPVGDPTERYSTPRTETRSRELQSDSYEPPVVHAWSGDYEEDDGYRRRRDGRKPERGRGRERDPYASEGKSKKPKNTRREEYDDEEFDEEEFNERRQKRAERKAQKERERLEALAAAGPPPILLPEYITVQNLAEALGVKIKVFMANMEELGFEDLARDSILTGETAALVAQEYGFDPTVQAGEESDLKPRPPPEDPSSLPLRPPVVTIMGHVDHGKTTLLDYLRKSSIAAGEHGGITQHIGAFSVNLSSGKQITFLDTPGHAAFLSMRQRGANVTDMVILVVAADDSVKPQTIEAIKHARAAKVPIIVAINKIDKDQANVERVKSDLATNGVEIEDFGGDVQVVLVSGKTGQGMEDLEENILTLSEMLDIRAETDGMAEGWVLESTIKPIGRVATILVKRGTLRQGDFIVAGTVWAKVRSLRNEAGEEVEEAPPGTAVEVLGWKEPPAAGDAVLQAPDEGKAKNAVRYREQLKAMGEQMVTRNVEHEQEKLEEELKREKREKETKDTRGGRKKLKEEEEDEDAQEKDKNAEPETKIVNFIVKGDVHGSVEAVTASIMEIGSNEVRPRVLISAPGHITESEVEHAATSGAMIINFNNIVPGRIKRMADESGVRILDHNIIYNMAEDVKGVLSDLLPPTISWKVLGEAEVLQIFPINLKGRQYKNVAGVRVRNGVVARNTRARVMRNGEAVFEGEVETLKQGKKDAVEIRKGGECGISFVNWQDMKVGDQIQMIEEVREKRRL